MSSAINQTSQGGMIVGFTCSDIGLEHGVSFRTAVFSWFTYDNQGSPSHLVRKLQPISQQNSSAGMELILFQDL